MVVTAMYTRPMPRTKSDLGRLRERVGHTAQTAADTFGIPVRAVRNYEHGGGSSPRTLKEKIAYAEWLIRKAQALNLPDIPGLAELLPDVYGSEKKAPGGNPEPHTVERPKGANQWPSVAIIPRPAMVASGTRIIGVPHE